MAYRQRHVINIASELPPLPPLPLPPQIFGPLWRVIAVIGFAVSSGVVGCLVLAQAVNVLLGLIRWVNLLSGLQNRSCVAMRLILDSS